MKKLRHGNMKNLSEVTQVTQTEQRIKERQSTLHTYVMLLFLFLMALRARYGEYHFLDEKIKAYRVCITFSR